MSDLDWCTETGKNLAAKRGIVQHQCFCHPDSQEQVSIVPAVDCFALVLGALTGGPDLASPELGKLQFRRPH